MSDPDHGQDSGIERDQQDPGFERKPVLSTMNNIEVDSGMVCLLPRDDVERFFTGYCLIPDVRFYQYYNAEDGDQDCTR